MVVETKWDTENKFYVLTSKNNLILINSKWKIQQKFGLNLEEPAQSILVAFNYLVIFCKTHKAHFVKLTDDF